jgi:hypothetical protein
MDYTCSKPNFHGKFTINPRIVDEVVYEKRKREHLLEQVNNVKSKPQANDKRDEIIYRLRKEKQWTIEELSEFFKIHATNVYKSIQRGEKTLNSQ